MNSKKCGDLTQVETSLTDAAAAMATLGAAVTRARVAIGQNDVLAAFAETSVACDAVAQVEHCFRFARGFAFEAVKAERRGRK